jgi:hypothetical protein
MDALALSLHVTHLSFLQFRKILGDVFYVDEGPSGIFASLNGFEPCLFWGKIGSSMQVVIGGLKAWQLVDVAGILSLMCKQRDGINMLVSESRFGDLIHCVETQVA